MLFHIHCHYKKDSMENAQLHVNNFYVSVAQCSFSSYFNNLHEDERPEITPPTAVTDGFIKYNEEITITCTKFVPTPVVTKLKCVYDFHTETYKFDFARNLACPG